MIYTCGNEENRIVTDDSMAVELLGMTPAYVLSDTLNLKITSPEDIVIANAVFRERGCLN